MGANKVIGILSTVAAPLVKAVLVSFIAMLLCLIPACFEKPAALLAKLGSQGWVSLMWYGVFVTALAFLFWY